MVGGCELGYMTSSGGRIGPVGPEGGAAGGGTIAAAASAGSCIRSFQSGLLMVTSLRWNSPALAGFASSA